MTKQLSVKAIQQKKIELEGLPNMRILENISGLQSVLHDLQTKEKPEGQKEIVECAIDTLKSVMTLLESNRTMTKEFLEASYGDSSNSWNERQTRWPDNNPIENLIRNEIWHDLLQIIKLSAKLGEGGSKVCQTYGQTYVEKLKKHIPNNYQKWKIDTIRALEKLRDGDFSDDIVARDCTNSLLALF